RPGRGSRSRERQRFPRIHRRADKRAREGRAQQDAARNRFAVSPEKTTEERSLRMETKLQRGGGHPVNSTNPKGTYFMKVLKLLCVASTLAIPATASATTISFDLASSGYVQDSPVAPDLFAGSGLMLSSDIVTACAGEC